MSPEEELMQSAERFKRALFDCDTDALRELIAEDYRGVDPRGHLQDKGMTLEAFRPGGVELDRYDVEDLDVRVIGKVGLVTGTGRIQGRYLEHVFAHHVRFLDVYVHGDDLWRLHLSQVTPLEGA